MNILTHFDKIININELRFSIIVFPGFLQKFLNVTICPIHGTDTTETGCVWMEKGWILAPAVTCRVTEGTDFMVLVSSSVTMMELGSPLRNHIVEVSYNYNTSIWFNLLSSITVFTMEANGNDIVTNLTHCFHTLFLTNIYDLNIIFPVFLQEFPRVTICPVQSMGNTMTRFVRTER